MAEKNKDSEEHDDVHIRNMLASIERTFLPVNSQLGKYQIIEEVDRGGMAVVYKAIQLDLKRIVALKVMPANISINRGFVERFLSEAHAIGQLSHPNIVKIIEVATEDNIYYLAMEYIPGQNLYYYLHYQKPKLVDVIEIVIKLTEALSYAHGQKIIHRDLKLNNVIMRDQLSPVLIDFGLAKALENDESLRPGITRTGEVMGSPSYMAPERLLGGPVDQRSDICSLGIMLYEMLTFKNPYLDQRNLHQTTINVMESNPIPPRRLVPWLPVEIEAITLKAMAKDPENRYQTMGQFRSDLQSYLHGDPILARPPSLISLVKHYVKRHWAPLAIGFIVLLFSGLFAATMYLQSRKAESYWQLIYNDEFDKADYITNWKIQGDSLSDTILHLTMKNGDLRATTPGMRYALLNKHFNRDILIECDMYGNPDNIYNAGIFLSGNRPDSAYCFHVNRDANGTMGMTMPGSDFVFFDVPPGVVPLRSKNHIVIERFNDQISFTVNNVVVSKIYDNFPPLGKRHEKIGLFLSNGSCRFDNLKVYRRAIPEVPSPVLVADRFMEQGDFEAAVDEYSNLLVDFAENEMAKEIKVKMINCLVRMERFDEALRLISGSMHLFTQEDPLKPQIYFLQACIYSRESKFKSADSLYQLIAEKYPHSQVNQAMINSLAISLDSCIDSRKIDSAKKIFGLVADRYKKNSIKTEVLFEKLIGYYEKTHMIDSSIVFAEWVIEKFNRTEPCAQLARYHLACAYLNKGKKDDAKVIFDQLITGNVLPDRTWELLDIMAQISGYEFMQNEELMLYSRINRDASQSTGACWMALVAKATILQKDSSDIAKVLFKDVVSKDHPFPAPRLIAQYYLDSISDNVFKERWNMLFPYDNMYLFYVARKAHAARDDKKALLVLNQLKESLSKKEWNYFRVIRILSNLDRW